MERPGYRIFCWIVLAVAVVAMVPFMLASAYVFPVNDDFSFAFDHIGVDPFTSAFEGWRSWSGRYLGTFLSSANPLAVSDNPLPLLGWTSRGAILFVGFSFIGGTWLAFRRSLGQVGSAAAGAFALCMFLYLCPSIAQEFYWFSSMTCYTIPSGLALLCLALLACRHKAASASAALLALLVPGGNEVTGVLFVMTLLYLAYTTRRRDIAACAVLSIVGISLVVLSPGNGVRMQARLSAHPYLWTLAVSTGQTVGWMFLWLPTLLLASVVYVPLWGVRLSRLPAFRGKMWVFLIFAVTAVLLAHVPPAFGLSSIMTDRTANALLPFFILFYFFGVTMAIARRREAVGDFCGRVGRRVMAMALFAVTFTTVLSPWGNFTTACADVFGGTGRRYHDAQLGRMMAARAASTPDTLVVLAPLPVYPETLYISDLPGDTANGFTHDYARYFGFRGAVAGPDSAALYHTPYQILRARGKESR